MPPKKDQAPIYIDGPKMDWSMDDGLWKVNTLIRWAGSFGLKNLKVWQKDETNLTLTFIWNVFETYCKPHSNKLQAR